MAQLINGFPAALGKHTSLLPRWPGFKTEYLKAPWFAPSKLKKKKKKTRKLIKTAQQPKAKQSGRRTNRKENPNSHTQEKS